MHTGFNETYHSIHGAIQESNHVFIRSGLHFKIDHYSPREIDMLEVGLGTGLNVLLTLLDKKAAVLPIRYDAVEAFPLPLDLARQLNYSQCLKNENANSLLLQLHEATWGESVRLNPNFSLRKLHSAIQSTILLKESYDLVYFDAFAPNTQPELWGLDVMELIIRSLKHNGIFVTYSAKGQLKRDLRTLGMKVETLAGPPGKAEMIRAIKEFN